MVAGDCLPERGVAAGERDAQPPPRTLHDARNRPPDRIGRGGYRDWRGAAGTLRGDRRASRLERGTDDDRTGQTHGLCELSRPRWSRHAERQGAQRARVPQRLTGARRADPTSCTSSRSVASRSSSTCAGSTRWRWRRWLHSKAAGVRVVHQSLIDPAVPPLQTNDIVDGTLADRYVSILDTSGPQFVSVLRLIADDANHPDGVPVRRGQGPHRSGRSDGARSAGRRRRDDHLRLRGHGRRHRPPAGAALGPHAGSRGARARGS